MAARTQRTICFVATGRSGLGHLRRVSTIARALRRMAPGTGVELMTNAPPQGLEPGDLAAYEQIHVCERVHMAAALKNREAALAVLDTIVVPDAETLPQKMALVLRETPSDRTTQFALPSGRPWDALLIPNPELHWLPSEGSVPAHKVYPLGWIYRQAGAVVAIRNAPPDVLVATGGGGTKETTDVLYPMIDAVIAAAQKIVGNPFRVRQAIGPRAQAFGALQSADQVFDPGGTLNQCFARAGIVISTAGYNSVLELAVTDTPTLLLPIPRSLDDQAERTRRWGKKLGLGYDPGRAERAATWLSDQIVNPRRRHPVDLGPSGEERAAHILLDLLR